MVRRLREWVTAALVSNFTTTAATATATLLSFNVGVNEVWIVDVQLTAQCSSTGGVKYAVAAPTGATIEGWVYSSGAAILTLIYQRLTAIGTLTSTLVHTVATTPAPDMLRFTVTNGSTTGAVTVQAASGTPGQTTTIFAGASLTAHRVS